MKSSYVRPSWTQAAKLAGDFCGEIHRRAVREFGAALNLLAVFVGSGEEPCVDAQGALAPGYGIADDGGVGMAQVRARIHVINGRGEVVAAEIVVRFLR
jgi:hypothetical protein